MDLYINIIITLIISYLIWFIILYSLRKIIFNKKFIYSIILFIIIIPLFLILYHFIHSINYYKKKKIKLLEIEMNIERYASRLLPAILFGIGILYSGFSDKKIIKILIPYLALAVFFGTVIPSILVYMNNNYKDFDILFFFESLEFNFVSFGYGLLLAGIFIPLKMMS